MWYKIKRYFQYQLKVLENYFRTIKNQREITRAYRVERTFPEITISWQMLTWTIATISGIGLVSIVVLYSGNILSTTGNIKNALYSNKKLSAEKPKGKNLALTQKENNISLQQIINKDTITDKDIEKSSLKNRILHFSEKLNYLLLANKASRTMWVFLKKDNSWSLFRTYYMAVGEKDGMKIMAGDKKTPEGSYFIIGRKERSELHKMYGPLAFVLNYPNEEDKKHGRTGNGIWIHGTNPDSIPLKTRGCLELENRNILELGSYLKTGIGTPVVIVNNNNIQDPLTIPDFKKIEIERNRAIAKYKKQRDFFVSLLEKWKYAWESKDIENYAIFYNKDTFIGQGLDWGAWKERKSRTFEIYSEIEISLDKLFLADISESTAVMKFMQGYKSDLLHVVNGKKLNLVKSKGSWKIYQENTFPQEELLL